MSTTDQPDDAALVGPANLTHTPPDCTCEHRSYIPTKWAMRLIGKDEQGRDCTLGLDWRGRWHQIAGPVYKRVADFRAKERAFYEGRVIERYDDCVLMSNPPQYRWRDVEAGHTFTMRAGTELEVVP
jgi:hypothetical protein